MKEYLINLYKENLSLLDKMIEKEKGELSEEELEQFRDDMYELNELIEDKIAYQYQLDNIDNFWNIADDRQRNEVTKIMELNNRNYKITLKIKI